MNRDKKVLYTVSAVTLVLLLIALFVDLGSSKIVAACLLLPLALATCLLIRKRGSLSINKREVLLLAAVIGALYVIVVELTCMFFGSYVNPYTVDMKGFFITVLPLTAIIVTTELIRYVILAQKNTPASILAFLSCVAAEVLMFSSIPGITSFNRFMDLVGMTLFPAISANIYYHYVSKRFGMWPNIAYRLITTLYIYFIPTTTGMTDALSACIKIMMPILMLAFLSALYEKKKKNAVQKGRKLSTVGAILTVAFVSLMAMLISCQFRFGAIVIATESMTGEINKGDMIIYEQYDDQTIKEGQIIVFLQSEAKIVHRVIKIENVGGELRYYTQGDANESPDIGYRTKADIVGLTDAKIAYVGYPTLWLRDILQN